MAQENPKETTQARETYPTPPEGWTCFHCGEHFGPSFRGWQEARNHFGDNVRGDAFCQYTAKQVRVLEDLLRSYQEEDTPRDRVIHRLQSEHAVALRREEEKGYARGLQASYFQANSKEGG